MAKTQMTAKEANRERACVCCGSRGAVLLRLRDGRNYRACERCLSGCDECLRVSASATIRDPIGSEALFAV